MRITWNGRLPDAGAAVFLWVEVGLGYLESDVPGGMNLMLTEESLREGIEALRRDGGQVAFQVAVGAEDRYLAGSVLAGLPVTECMIPLPPGIYLLLVAPVIEPWIACAELGAE